MEFICTNGANPDFHLLCGLLDEHLNDAIGGFEKRKKFVQFNQLDTVRDVILVYDGGTPVGCAGFRYYEEGTAEVKRVFIRAEYRGRGISKKLMELLETKAKEKGCGRLILETGAFLTESMGLYRKIGYTVIENYGPYRDMKESVCMEKLLLSEQCI
jgi:putative acetyltransferase